MSGEAHGVFKGVVGVVVADDELDGILKDNKIYAGRAPEGAIAPYITCPDMTDAEFALLGGNKVPQSTELQIRIWANNPDEVLTIYTALHRLLNRRKINLNGFILLRGRLLLNGWIPDPDTKGLYQGIVVYMASTVTP